MAPLLDSAFAAAVARSTVSGVLRPRAAARSRRGARTAARALPRSSVTRADHGATACALHMCSSHVFFKPLRKSFSGLCCPPRALGRGRARAAVLVERVGRDRGQLVQAGQVVRCRAVGDHR